MDVPGVGRAEAVAPRDGRDRRRVPLDERARASSSPRDAEARRSAGAAVVQLVDRSSASAAESSDGHATVMRRSKTASARRTAARTGPSRRPSTSPSTRNRPGRSEQGQSNGAKPELAG